MVGGGGEVYYVEVGFVIGCGGVLVEGVVEWCIIDGELKDVVI